MARTSNLPMADLKHQVPVAEGKAIHAALT